MQKRKIEIKIEDFPQELHYIFKDATVYDTSSHPSTKVLYSDLGYYIKIGKKHTLKREAEMVELFARGGMGAGPVAYLSYEQDYMVTKSAKGEDALHFLKNPQRLCKVLAEAMKYLHSRPITDVPFSPCMDAYAALEKGKKLQQDTLIHGDFCLPNVMLEDWNFRSFIDLGLAGVGDKHIDIYWVLWSLKYNLKTDQYTDYFLDCYGRDKIDMDILKIVAEVEG